MGFELSFLVISLSIFVHVTKDAVELAFLSELLSGGYSDGSLLKWSLHPVIGAKMRSGDWLRPESASASLVREAMEEALREDKPVVGLDYQFDVAEARSSQERRPAAGRAPGTPPAANGGPRGKGSGGARRSTETLRTKASERESSKDRV